MDSGVEQQYVEAIRAERDAIVFYFKFPPAFKVDLPDLIGNYNPDWGVARLHRDGKVEVRTWVHETKGGEVSQLRFPNEKRKVRCAEKYFASIGVNYKLIEPTKVGGWWETSEEQPRTLGL
jgi:type III restriction enzyme